MTYTTQAQGGNSIMFILVYLIPIIIVIIGIIIAIWGIKKNRKKAGK